MNTNKMGATLVAACLILGAGSASALTVSDARKAWSSFSFSSLGFSIKPWNGPREDADDGAPSRPAIAHHVPLTPPSSTAPSSARAAQQPISVPVASAVAVVTPELTKSPVEQTGGLAATPVPAAGLLLGAFALSLAFMRRRRTA